ncbi:MAG: hypothetical protein IPK65_06690 [Gammaproteobacteria bacterium]|nr:hypothetical protein [Gammaproteobacteria bacterium]
MDLMKQRPLRMPSLFSAPLCCYGRRCLLHHQAEHALTPPEETCPLCQAADHMQYGLVMTILPAVMLSVYILPHAVFSMRFPFSVRGPSARSPPVGRPA